MRQFVEKAMIGAEARKQQPLCIEGVWMASTVQGSEGK